MVISYENDKQSFIVDPISVVTKIAAKKLKLLKKSNFSGLKKLIFIVNRTLARVQK